MPRIQLSPLNTTHASFIIELVTSGEPVGIVTLIQRDYLQSPDLGFALLPAFEKQGYAFEAVSLFLNDFFSVSANKEVHAIILEHNRSSIQLVQKLGFLFSEHIEVNGEQLSLYSKKLT
tara:strand:- start:1350 stop:1706 length:357 start_codon:yes stop_codon:yes gene_type:complete